MNPTTSGDRPNTRTAALYDPRGTNSTKNRSTLHPTLFRFVKLDDRSDADASCTIASVEAELALGSWRPLQPSMRARARALW